MKIRRDFLFFCQIVSIISLIEIASCSSPVSTSQTPPFPDEFYEIVQVGDYRIPFHCLGQGEPTIILENGDNFVPWDDNTLKRFADLGRVCFYRRVGYLEEPPEVRTVKDQIHDLHNLLTIVKVPGPYILVGVSRGGLHLLLFAQEYPEEVAGLVFIESQPPTYYSLLEQRFGQENEDDPDWVKQFRSDITIGWDYTELREKIDVLASTNQAMEVTDLGDIPMVVLVAGDELDWNDDWEKIVADSWLEAQTSLSQLSENSRIEIVPDVSHATIAYSSSVDYAVEEVYKAVKQP